MNTRSRSETKLGKIAPVWIPDNHSSRCQECATKFTFLLRKHHCRACGRLLCGDCSKYQASLEYLGGCLERVCQHCHETLKLVTKRKSIRKTKSLNDFDEVKENISRLIRSQQLADAEAMCPDTDNEDFKNEFFGHLPLELWARIIQSLQFEDQKECRLVSHTFRDAVSLTTFHSRAVINIEHYAERKDLILKTYSSQECDTFKHFIINSYPTEWGFSLTESSMSASKIQTLVLCDTEISPGDFFMIISKLSHLETLGLINCKQLFMSGTFLSNSSDIKILGERLIGLRSLTLDRNNYLSDLLLLRIATLCPQLETLSLEDVKMMNHSSGVVTKLYPEAGDTPASSSVVTWRIVSKILKSLRKTLKSVNLSRNNGIKIEDLCDMEDFKIDDINLSGCSCISAQGFLKFLEQQRNSLKNINIAGARQITIGPKDQSEAILKLFENIENINLSENSVMHLQSMSNMKRIKILTMDNLDTPGSVICSSLLSTDLSQLTQWRARHLSMASRDLVNILSQRNLRITKLDLSRGSEGVITDGVVSAICDNLTLLEHLDLSYNIGVSDIGTLGLSDENIKQSLDEMMKQGHKISLASRAEKEIVITSQTLKVTSSLVLTESISQATGNLSNLSRLRHIDLSGTSVTSLTLCRGLASPDLRHLAVSQCRGGLVTDLGLQEMCRKHRRLSHLILSSTCISDMGLLASVSHTPRLIHLDLGRCSLLTPSCLSPLSHLCPNIQTLLLSGSGVCTADTVKIVKECFHSIKRIEI